MSFIINQGENGTFLQSSYVPKALLSPTHHVFFLGPFPSICDVTNIRIHGKNVWTTGGGLQNRYDRDISSACIGQATDQSAANKGLGKNTWVLRN